MRPLRLPLIALALVVAACSDRTTATNIGRYHGPMSNVTLADYIEQEITALLPNGLENAVDARWASVRRQQGAGNTATAEQQFNALVLFIARKTSNLTPPSGMTKTQAAALLITNMSLWLHGGANGPAFLPTQDVAVAYVPAGEALFLQAPSEHAGVEFGAGSTAEDRVIVIEQDPTPYPAQCEGPLDTRRCEYPLFYRIDSYPHLALLQPGKVAVCMLTTGDRRPLEYPQDESPGPRPVDDRLRLAHERPAAGGEVPGGTIEDGIEILPKSASQSGQLVDCDAPSPFAMNAAERALDKVAKWLSPKSAWAYDSGPEADFQAFSNFNAVDPAAMPDLSVTNVVASATILPDTFFTVSYAVSNVSRRNGGDATGPSTGTKVSAYLSADTTISTGDIWLGTADVPAMAPDATPFPVSSTAMAPSTPGTYWLIIRVLPSANGEVSTTNNTVLQQVTVSGGPILY